jgi:hypothetical protein
MYRIATAAQTVCQIGNGCTLTEVAVGSFSTECHRFRVRFDLNSGHVAAVHQAT